MGLNDFGPLVEPFLGHLENAIIGWEKVSVSPSAELYYSSMEGIEREDPKYFLVTDKEILATFGATGLVRDVEKKKGKGVISIIERDGQNRYKVKRNNLPVNGISNNTDLSDNMLSLEILDYVYSKASELPNDRKNILADIFHNFTGEKAIARFKDWNRFVGLNAIWPDQDSDHGLPALTTADRCGYNCFFCPEGGGLSFPSLNTIVESLSNIKETRDKYHEKVKKELYEIFINTSDIWWHDLSPKSPIKAKDLVALVKSELPEIIKLGSFVGVRNTLEIVRRYGLDHILKARDNLASDNPKQIGEGYGLNRVYIGIETGHSKVSKLLNKPETFEDKKRVLEIYRELGIPIKAILQYGIGKGYILNPKEVSLGENAPSYVSWKEAADETVRLISETPPYRVLFSEFQPLKNIPIDKLYESGQIIKHPDKASIEKERKYMENKLERMYQKGKIIWQGDPARKQWTSPIESNYHEFVDGKERMIIKKEAA